MKFLLDTNAISEATKPGPNAGLIQWLAETEEDTIFLSVMTLAELRYGIERLPVGRRRLHLQEWLNHDLKNRFEKRLLSIDPAIAEESGRLIAASEAQGRPLEIRDALIAATARIRQLALVTRNVRDFEINVKAIINPWN